MDGDTLMSEQLTLFDEVSIKKVDGDTKECFNCKRNLPFTSFRYGWSRKDGSIKLQNICKACKNVQTLVLKKLKLENIMPNSKDYKCPVCFLTSKMIQDYHDPDSRKKVTWVLDHNHKTGKFRGWLCNTCNSALGWLDDDPIKLRRALAYLIDNK